MKKFISLCLVITIIMSSLNPGIVNALSNYVNGMESQYSTGSKSETEKEEDSKDKESDKKSDLEKSTISKKENISNNSARSGKKIQLQKVNVGISFHDTLREVFTDLQVSKFSGDIKIKFMKDYTTDSDDRFYLEGGDEPSSIEFSAATDVTVTVDGDLKFYRNDKTYQPNDTSPRFIAFDYIKLKFTNEHSIFANGAFLHFGKYVEMVGDKYPKIFAGSADPRWDSVAGNPINNQVRIFIESGKYSEISTCSHTAGRKITKAGTIYFFGGYAKEINSGQNNTHDQVMYVKMYGGNVDKIIDSHTNITRNIIVMEVRKNVTVKQILNVQLLTVGTDLSDSFQVPSKLTITEDMKLMKSGVLIIGEKGILEIGEKASSIRVGIVWFRDESTVRVPGNRNKDNVPLILDMDAIMDGIINIESSTDITQQEFYLLKLENNNKPAQNTYRIPEDQYFYLDEIEKGPQASNGDNTWYFKARAKEKGPLIYDVSSNKFSYIDMKGQKQDAWWLDRKTLDFTKTLNYNDLAKYSEYYVLSPEPVELQIIGNGGNRTLKFNNDRHNNRPFNIHFNGLSASDSEFSFTNINSMKVSGTNSITQNVANKIALTYSFVGNSGDTLSLDDNSNFVVYSKDANSNKYNIRDNIVNSGNAGNASIVNMSFEDSISSIKDLQLHPMDSNDRPKKFSTKTGYDEISLLLPGNGKDYLLSKGNKTEAEGVYYYQSAKNGNSTTKNSGTIAGPIGTKFTLNPNSKKNYYKVNDKQRVHVIASQNNNNYYYLDDNLSNAMNNVAHTGFTHEVVLLGDYTTKSGDSESIKNHSGNTKGITFKTKVDGWKYLLNVNDNIELKIDSTGNEYPVTFDDIKFKYELSDKWIYADGRDLTFGSNVEMEGQNYPSISGGTNSGSSGGAKNTRVTIKSGTYKDVTGNSNDTVENVNLTINKGTFNGKVIGVNGGTANDATLAINATSANSARFEGEVIGVNGGKANNATLTITGTTSANDAIFNGKVIGITTGSTLTGNLNMTIDDATFNKDVYGSASITTRDKFNWKNIFKSNLFAGNQGINLQGTLNFTIGKGIFYRDVVAVSEEISGKNAEVVIIGGYYHGNLIGNRADNTILNMEIRGPVCKNVVVGDDSISKPKGAESVTLDIKGGTFEKNVFGSKKSKETTINVSGGVFIGNTGLYGNEKTSSNNVTININGNITIPTTVGAYDKLVVGSNANSVLTTGHMHINQQDGNLEMKNSSEVKLTGDKQSVVNELTIDGTGNTLTLDMNKTTVPLKVTSTYNPGNEKLTLNSLGQKGDNKELIEFSVVNADVNNFNFMDANYYIREIDSNGNQAGNKINLYEKMSPTSLDFKLDMNTSDLDYSINGVDFNDAWWYQPSLSNKNLTFSEENMFKYKGMELFKRNHTISSGNKSFEITNDGDNKNISLDLGTGTGFDLKLKDSKLTNSTIDAKNLNNIKLEGSNSISANSAETKPAFSYQMSGDVQRPNKNSYLAVYTDESQKNIEASSGKSAKVIDFKFNKESKNEDNVKLVSKDNSQNLNLTIPSDTGRLGVLFESSNNTTYNLYHHTGTTGNSVYVAGDTDVTFKESFEPSLNNSVNTYEYVRRANPVKSININVTRQMDFSVDTRTSGIDGIKPSNWSQHFNAKDMDIDNKSLVVKDVFTDKKGTTHHFGQTNPSLEAGYLGVKSSNTMTNGIELVKKDQLDTDITNSTSGVKMALKFKEGLNEIPIDENKAIATNPLETWNIPSNTNKKLKIEPDFTGNDIFFNVDMNSPDTLNSSHNFIFIFGLKTP